MGLDGGYHRFLVTGVDQVGDGMVPHRGILGNQYILCILIHACHNASACFIAGNFNIAGTSYLPVPNVVSHAHGTA